ncbi:MAG TPA: hypothetical protein VMN37_00995 [Gemmatimonadales bacterium]|nr:hypothetical protein [Gemmatimonadales bacterium]
MISQRLGSSALTLALLATAACGGATSASGGRTPGPEPDMSTSPPSPDPRIGLRAGVHDAGQAIWNLRIMSITPSPENFAGSTNSDIAFTGPYAIQGNYHGFQVWDISDPQRPRLTTGYVCPASQSDVSVYRNLLFVSGEDLSARLDCGTEGVPDSVSADRLRGLRIFDISDIRRPRNVGNVQTCRGSHTHSVLVDPRDTANVYVYISGAAQVRSPSELPGCVDAAPDDDPSSALFRIEVVKVPLADPGQAAVVSSPRIFTGLTAPPEHGEAPEDIAAEERELAGAKARGAFVATIDGKEQVLPDPVVDELLRSLLQARQRSGPPIAADSAELRALLPQITLSTGASPVAPNAGPTQCHDITLYPAIGLAGGACGGYGLLLDISDPVHPVRIDQAADSNFSYWHSATFNHDGTKILFSDEWGGGGQPKCRATDRQEWGANAIFTLADRKMQFRGYYKLPVPQSPLENCVAHNGSLIPIPGRDVMAQAWYQGGISVFDWTDAENPREIAYFDRGPMDSTRLEFGGSWSVYWYNGVLVSSETQRGLDILELVPSGFLSRNEIEAARTVRLDYLNVQGQPKFVWPPSFPLARAYLDQLERSEGFAAERLDAVRGALEEAERASGAERSAALAGLATDLEIEADAAADPEKARALARAVRDLAGA